MTDRITIRMYKVGFGDCFLVTFWDGERPTRVLVDCGTITEGARQVSRVAGDVVRTCGEGRPTPRIDLVVATHRHRDHVGGFADPVWAGVEVGEVWMPWTEDPRDPKARRIRERQSALAAELTATLGVGLSRSLVQGDEEPLSREIPARASAPKVAAFAMARNALTNEKAMATVHRGFKGTPARVFLPEGDGGCETRKVTGTDGVLAHVLGPPRDEAAIAAMDPPSGAGYLRANAGGGTEGGERLRPFGDAWVIDAGTFDRNHPDSTLNDDDVKALVRFGDEPASTLAAALDRAVNNTSLILVFEVGDAFLVFPGDAQWGAWKAALGDARSRALLERTTFLKVGHHGSHNATPKELIEGVIGQRFTALFSTAAVTRWPNIPRGPLVEAIARKAARYARSDREDAAKADGFTVETDLYIECELPVWGNS